jgi:hypothetical protein
VIKLELSCACASVLKKPMLFDDERIERFIDAYNEENGDNISLNEAKRLLGQAAYSLVDADWNQFIGEYEQDFNLDANIFAVNFIQGETQNTSGLTMVMANANSLNLERVNLMTLPSF